MQPAYMLDIQEDSDDDEVADATSASQDSPSVAQTEADIPTRPAPRNTVRILPPQPQSRPAKQNNGECQRWNDLTSSFLVHDDNVLCAFLEQFV